MDIENFDEPKVDNQRKRLKKMLLDEDEDHDINIKSSSSMNENISLLTTSIAEDEIPFTSELEFNDYGQYARWITSKVYFVESCNASRIWILCVLKQEFLSPFEEDIYLQV